jgi:hypothetical protein
MIEQDQILEVLDTKAILSSVAGYLLYLTSPLSQ